MKARKIIYYFLMFLPLLTALCVLPFLPNTIPAHYDFDNQVTRWGSKYECLLYPVTTILMGYFLLAMAKIAARQESTGHNNEKIILISGMLILLYFNIMNIFSLYTDFHKIENLSEMPVNLFQLLFGILGLVLILIGNIMPKAKMNSVFGLRTCWSRKDETVWKKSQRFGGISFILTGILMILISIFTKDVTCFIWSMIVLLLTAVIDVVYTYSIAR